MSTASTLPRWDVSTIFPSLESPAFADAFDAVVRQVDELTVTFDSLEIERPTAPLTPDAATIAAVERVIAALNDTLAPYRTDRKSVV